MNYQINSFSSEVEQEFSREYGEDISGDALSESDLDDLNSGEKSEKEFARRLREISQRNRESDLDNADSELQRLWREMEDEFFFKGLAKKLKKRGMKLLNRGLQVVQSNPMLRNTIGNTPAFQAINAATQLARGNLRGLLTSAAKGVIPGAAPVMNALGFEVGQDGDNNERWSRFVQVARGAYEHMNDNLTDNADDVMEASRLAREAYEAGFRTILRGRGQANDKVIRLRLAPGESVTLVVEGR
jgi:hypothetical protein